MSVSAKQAAANRANAQHSTGPRTEAGKRTSRLNAITHGLSGLTVVMTPQQTAAWTAYRDRMLPNLRAVAPLELDLAERIVHDSWRLHRSLAIETNIFALGEHDYSGQFNTGDVAMDSALIEARVYQHEAKNLNLLTLYQQRLDRAIQKNLAALRQFQRERYTAAAAARRLASFSTAAPSPALPQRVEKNASSAANGFVYASKPRVAAPPPARPVKNEKNDEDMAA